MVVVFITHLPCVCTTLVMICSGPIPRCATGSKASRGLSGGRVNARRGDKQGSSRQELEELAAEKNALLDYIQVGLPTSTVRR